MILTGSIRAGSRWRLALLFFVLGLAACAPEPEPTPTHTLTPPPATQTPEATPWQVARPTLPPTWTPTSTYTPLPPSLTPSPTGTPSVTPTLGTAERCDQLWLYGHPAQGAQLSIKDFDQVSFLWQYPLADESVTLTITRAGSDRARVLNVPGPNNVAASIPFRVLYGPGLYRWTLVPEDADGEPLESCRLEGSFTITTLRWEEHRWPLPDGREASTLLITPTVTPTPTATPTETATLVETPTPTATASPVEPTSTALGEFTATPGALATPEAFGPPPPPAATSTPPPSPGGN
jgi:hypothetical protein